MPSIVRPDKQLIAFRRVAEQSAKEDKTNIEKNARRVLEQDPKAFFTMLRDMNAAHQKLVDAEKQRRADAADDAPPTSTAPAEQIEPDPRTPRLRELIRKVLDDYEKGKGAA